MVDINKNIQKRYSPVIFKNEVVSDDLIKTLFEAARWAPSSYNDQPWHFLIGRKNKDDTYTLLLDCLVDANKEWAKNAPVLGISLANMISSKTGKENRYAFHDVGMAMENLLIQAAEHDVFVHQMGGYNREKAIQLLKIPDHFKPVAMFALGYRGDLENAPEHLVSREKQVRVRKSLEEVYRTETF